MNPIKKIFTLAHFLGWMLLFLLGCWILASEGHLDWLSKSATLVTILIIIFYSHFFILTYFLYQRKYVVYVIGLLLVLRISPVYFLWAYGVDKKEWLFLGDPYFSFLAITLFCIAFSWVAKAVENRFIHSLKKEKIQNQSMQAELSYLKSQISPHFLFNTLNNIHALAYSQSVATPDAIMRLSSLMRYMLYESNAATVSLQREIDYLHDFINLQQLRYRKTPIVDFRVEGCAENCQVAPLLFIHLLENAYKHSPANLEAKDIKINLIICKNTLTFLIENPVRCTKEQAIEEVGGIGLENVKKRLELIYPDQHVFETTLLENAFKVKLEIKCSLL